MARAPEKSEGAFRTIREVADWLGVPTHVLRFWESKFAQIEPVKGAGGRRYYRPEDMRLLGGIKVLLHDEGLPIRGVVKKIDDEGIDVVMGHSPPLDRPDSSSAPKTRRVIRSDDERPDAATVIPMDRTREEVTAGDTRHEAPLEPDLPEDLPAPSDPSPSQPDAPEDDETDMPPQPSDRPVPEPSDMPDQPDPPKTRPDDQPQPAEPDPVDPVDLEVDTLATGDGERLPEDDLVEPEAILLDGPTDEPGIEEAPEEPAWTEDLVDPVADDAPVEPWIDDAMDEPILDEAIGEPGSELTDLEPSDVETTEPLSEPDVAEPVSEFDDAEPAGDLLSQPGDAVIEIPVPETSRPDVEASAMTTQTIHLTPVNRRALRRVVRKLRGLIEEVESELNEDVLG